MCAARCSQFSVHEPVWVLWSTDDCWYPATITEIDNNNIRIKWLNPQNYDAENIVDLSVVRTRVEYEGQQPPLCSKQNKQFWNIPQQNTFDYQVQNLDKGTAHRTAPDLTDLSPAVNVQRAVHAPFPSHRPRNSTCPVLTTCRAARLKLLAYKQRKPPPRILCSALRFACRTPRSSTTFVFTRLISRQAARAVRRALPARTLTLFRAPAPACSVQRSSLAALCAMESHHSVFMYFNGGNIGYTHCILSLVVATLLRDLRPCLHRRRFRLFLHQVTKRSCNFRMRGDTLRRGKRRE